MDFTILAQTPLFQGIPAEELEKIFAVLNISKNCFRKGEMLAMQDELVNRLIILTRGSVKAEMTDPSGKLIKVEDIEAPNPLAILFLFGNHNRFPVQATAREMVEAVIIPKQCVLQLLAANELILKNYLDISADFAARLSRKLHFMSFRTIRQKIAMYLIEQSRKQESDTVELIKTKASLAEYFGVSRPVARTRADQYAAGGIDRGGAPSDHDPAQNRSDSVGLPLNSLKSVTSVTSFVRQCC